MTGVLDVLGGVCVIAGALLCLAAAIGLVRLPDVLTRMHAATKPQTLGLLLVLLGIGLTLRDLRATGLLVLIAVLQLFTAPVAAHLVGRTAYRTAQLRTDLLDRDELADDLRTAGFRLSSDAEEPNGEPEQEPREDDGAGQDRS
ncbi:multicomponent Na+:H+ antiporter subunit G [Friedmanniella endophytica]|uniref:Multicomponent Na+:H+ antiporter subunit G n=1 Tax=Microlunatus kandeliicorticis TaxID=1759536 RepID=A0A7W3IVG1_9ACTN|nr:monovalent cation/H(+) antiporter subunit G [Microlunatus kandeliicorticis]MBA8795996.1 multicomponent Na+:H+ antiporter subunit G [Microlunatus kandeliicorticis]